MLSTDREYHGAQLIVSISATLMPNFLEMARTNVKPRGPVFFTAVPQAYQHQYSGVNSFLPLRSDLQEMHPQEGCDEDLVDNRVFLDPKLCRDPSGLGINSQVDAMFEDACTRGRKKALLLDITLKRVYVAGSIFDKAEEMQRR